MRPQYIYLIPLRLGYVGEMSFRKLLAHFTSCANESPFLELPSSGIEGLLVSDALILQGRNGARYTAKWMSKLGKIYVTQGWPEFKEDQDIEEGDILLCKLYEGSKLWIAIVDKNGQYNTVFNTSNTTTDRLLKQGSQNQKKVENIKASNSLMEKPCHILQITKYKLNTHKCGIAREFADKVSAKNGESMEVQVIGCSSKNETMRWLYSSKGFKGFGSGWRAFSRMHQLKVGDFLLLQLTHSKLITMHIVRSEETEESCMSSSHVDVHGL